MGQGRDELFPTLCSSLFLSFFIGVFWFVDVKDDLRDHLWRIGTGNKGNGVVGEKRGRQGGISSTLVL